MFTLTGDQIAFLERFRPRTGPDDELRLWFAAAEPIDRQRALELVSLGLLRERRQRRQRRQDSSSLYGITRAGLAALPPAMAASVPAPPSVTAADPARPSPPPPGRRG